jgi:hypothetical protein
MVRVRIHASAFVLSVLGASIISTVAPAHDQSSGQANTLIGCWQKEIPPDPENAGKHRMTPQLQLCFHKNKTISGFYVEAEGIVGDFAKTWRFREPSTLIIDGKPCRFEYSADRQHFTLLWCGYRGEWRLECRRPNDDVCPRH